MGKNASRKGFNRLYSFLMNITANPLESVCERFRLDCKTVTHLILKQNMNILAACLILSCRRTDLIRNSDCDVLLYILRGGLFRWCRRRQVSKMAASSAPVSTSCSSVSITDLDVFEQRHHQFVQQSPSRQWGLRGGSSF